MSKSSEDGMSPAIYDVQAELRRSRRQAIPVREKAMSVQALQDYVFVSKSARHLKDKKRRETWPEAVERVKQMHLRRYPQAKEEIDWAFEQVLEKRVLGSQRSLQFGGTPIEKCHERIYNCSFSYCDRVRFFQEALFLLLAGCGVGFSVQKHHVAKLPEIHVPSRLVGTRTFVIPDSIKGWADALGALVHSYFVPNSGPVSFIYHLIRPEGSPLSAGGKAPGPEPLRVALEEIRRLLDRCLDNGQCRLRPIDAYDIIMHAAGAVLAGGVRRSATLALFSPDDMEMATAKTGNWFYENEQRKRSNNSALLIRHKTSREQFKELFKHIKDYGEPGFIWSDDEETGYNPCVEVGMYAYDQYGTSGWQFCNLCELNAKRIKTRRDFEIAVRAAAIIGTLQAGYTDFPYLGEVSEQITRREALLGISMTGMMESPDIVFDRELQVEMAELAKKVNDVIALKIGINPAARLANVKPAGTTSCILGTSSGIHPHHSRRYFRRVQAKNNEAPFNHFRSVNPQAVEKNNSKDAESLVTFCIETKEGAKTKKEVGALELLRHVKLTQTHWVEAGTRLERCVKPWLRHSVSNTINVKPHEWEEVEEYIYENRQHFAGVALLAHSGDLDYPQAPFCAVSTPEEIVEKYGPGSIFASGLIVDGLHAYPDLWRACDAVLGRLEAEEGLQKDWVRRARQFAERYFGGDTQKMLYCLKEVNNWKTWCDLKREWKEVDYSQLREDEDVTTTGQDSACAGGTCEVI